MQKKRTDKKLPLSREKKHLAFAHLHVHTGYSLLDGASRVKELIARTKELGMNSVAITDHGVMYGVIDFYKEAIKQGVHPIIGCEAYLAPRSRHDREEVDGTRYYHLILLAENHVGYKNLVKLVSLAHIEGMYYKPRVDKELLRRYHEGIICLSACIAGEIPQAILRGQMDKAHALVQEYVDIFGKENFFLEIQNHGLPEEQKAMQGIVTLAQEHGVNLVATNDAHYIRKEDSEFHDVLLAIQTNKTLDDPTRMRYAAGEFYLRSPEEMAALFPAYPEALENTAKIAARCQVDFTFGKLHLPRFPLPEGLTDAAYLKNLCEERLPQRYEEITPEIRERLDYELAIIHRMGYDSYFLIVWDFIEYARKEHIPVGPGRGSAAGSMVAYLLGITNLDPLRYHLLFERFLNPERVTMPDIDIDFCYIRREDVIAYVKKRYGEDHVAQIITFGTMAAKGAIRDVGRVMGLSYAQTDRVAKAVPNELGITIDKALEESQEFHAIYEESAENRRLIDFARDIEGLPRHSSIHAAGVVIARDPLTDYLPVQVSDGTLVTAYDKDHVEELGLLKMDFLGLRTLTIIADALKNIQQSQGIEIDINNIPLHDEKTSKMLCEGQTGAVFQMESAGMTALVKDLAPRGFEDLIPTVALYRPGPLGSGMVREFIEGLHGKRQPTYLHPLLEPILKETFGVVLYQEQVMQVVQVLANFTLGQADILRRAMGKKKHEVLLSQKENYLRGTQANGIEPELAEHIFDLLTHFADYGFNKSHSAAYALVAWQTAYLKAHYPAAFMAAMLSNVMDMNGKVAFYLELCKRMGIDVLPPDVNASQASFSVDGEAIRFGLAAVRNVGEVAMQKLMAVREAGGAFTSFFDFCERMDARAINKRVVESLIQCGAFDSLGAKRSQLLQVMGTVMELAARTQRDALSGQMGLFTDEEASGATVPLPDIEEAPFAECLRWEKENTGFYITGHPLDAYREILQNLTPIEELGKGKYQDKQRTRIGGLVAEIKNKLTRKGERMCFVRFEGLASTIEVIVFPRALEERAGVLLLDAPLVIEGRVNVTEDNVKLIAERMWALPTYHPNFYITVPPAFDNPPGMKALENTLSAHMGNRQVYIHCQGSWQPYSYGTDGSSAAAEAITSLLGAGCLQQK